VLYVCKHVAGHCGGFYTENDLLDGYTNLMNNWGNSTQKLLVVIQIFKSIWQ